MPVHVRECSLLTTWYFGLGRFMPKFEFETKIGPAAVVSALGFISTIFLGGMIWQQLTGEQMQLRKRVDQMDARLTSTQVYETSIAVLRNDMGHMLKSLKRIERMMKLGN